MQATGATKVHPLNDDEPRHVEPAQAQVNVTVLVPLLIGMPVDTRMGFGALKLPIDPN